MWPGRVTIRGQGRLVPLGNGVAVPKTAVYEATGDNGHPDAFVRFEVVDGRVEVREIRVLTKEDGRGIRSADMALFALDNLTEHAVSHVGVVMHDNPANPGNEWVADVQDEPDEAEVWQVRREVAEGRARKRGGVSMADLRRVARIYQEHPEAPVKAVSALMGMSERTAARRVREAREQDLLPDREAE